MEKNNLIQIILENTTDYYDEGFLQCLPESELRTIKNLIEEFSL